MLTDSSPPHIWLESLTCHRMIHDAWADQGILIAIAPPVLYT
jgi:hypothetical protein